MKCGSIYCYNIFSINSIEFHSIKFNEIKWKESYFLFVWWNEWMEMKFFSAAPFIEEKITFLQITGCWVMGCSPSWLIHSISFIPSLIQFHLYSLIHEHKETIHFFNGSLVFSLLFIDWKQAQRNATKEEWVCEVKFGRGRGR